MAQTKRKRRRKHRGTQAGTIDRAGRTSKPSAASRSTRPAAGASAKPTAAERRQQRLDTPPTWRGALNRAGIAALLLVVFVTLTQHSVAQGLALGAFAMVIYIPMSYYTDRALYRRRQRQKQRRGR